MAGVFGKPLPSTLRRLLPHTELLFRYGRGHLQLGTRVHVGGDPVVLRLPQNTKVCLSSTAAPYAVLISLHLL